MTINSLRFSESAPIQHSRTAGDVAAEVAVNASLGLDGDQDGPQQDFSKPDSHFVRTTADIKAEEASDRAWSRRLDQREHNE